MPADKARYLANRIIVKSHSSHNPPGHLCTAAGMSCEMIHLLIIRPLADRLCDVMEKGRQTQNGVRLDMAKHLQGMIFDIIVVMPGILLCLTEFFPFRKEDMHKSCLTEELHHLRVVGHESLYELISNALPTHLRKTRCQMSYCK